MLFFLLFPDISGNFPELKFNLRDRVLALLPPEEEMNKDFQDLADAVLEGIESGNKKADRIQSWI